MKKRRLGLDIVEAAHRNRFSLVLLGLTLSWLVVSFAVWLSESGAAGSNINSFGDALWWGIVTFLTVGYGDRYPITTSGRMFAGVLMLSGVIAIGIVTAKISAVFLEQALRRRRGIVDPQHLKDHFVICGWKENMHDLLEHVLDFNPELDANHLVLVAAISETAQELLRERPRLRDITIVGGPYYEETFLRRAAPERAKKVMILSDRTPQANGQIASPSEVDARTIMTAMTLSHIAKGTLVAAEILDPKLDQYLKLAHVSEIIYSREYSRLLLANASGGTGVSNIIFELLDPRNPTFIRTQVIAEQ